MAPQKARSFRSALLRWYSKNGRNLPWRRTRDPYRILVSEIMLQQTQVATVLPYYRNWLRRFPNFSTLSRTSESKVLHAWQGLGYYTRARNLLRTAKLVMDRHRGRFPRLIEQMRSLPGIGKYTAHAVASFAFDQPAAIVEANSARVLSRIFNLRTPIDSTAGQNKLWQYAAGLIPQKSASVYNSALLDLGALVCLPRNPKCGLCPVQRFCRAKDRNSLPRKRSRLETTDLVENHWFISRGDTILLVQSQKRWRGMWILPSLKRAAKHNGTVYSRIFPFTNHRVTLNVFRGEGRKFVGHHSAWFSKRAVASIPIPSPHRRAINALLN